MKKYLPIALITLTIVSLSAMAAKPCDQLKAEITAKLAAKNVKDYNLAVVAADTGKDQKVIGSCNGGTKHIVYKHN